MIVCLEPYFKQVANYYWDHIDQKDNRSIWAWLEAEFKCRRTIHFPCGAEEFYSGRRFDLEFDDDKDATFFILRWA